MEQEKVGFHWPKYCGHVRTGFASFPVTAQLTCYRTWPEGYRQYCQNIKDYVGVTLDRAFAEYTVADARESCLLPDAVSFETGTPLTCAGCTIWRGVLRTELKEGETVGIFGAGGGLGHLGCQFAKALGPVVVGIDAREEALSLAKKSGAEVLVDVRMEKEIMVKEVHRVTIGRGVDSAITGRLDAVTEPRLVAARFNLRIRRPIPELILLPPFIASLKASPARQRRRLIRISSQSVIIPQQQDWHVRLRRVRCPFCFIPPPPISRSDQMSISRTSPYMETEFTS